MREMELFLSVADASRILGVTPQTVRLMVRRGTLAVTAKTVGGIQLFRTAEVERLAAARRERARLIGAAGGHAQSEEMDATEVTDGREVDREDDHGGHP